MKYILSFVIGLLPFFVSAQKIKSSELPLNDTIAQTEPLTATVPSIKMLNPPLQSPLSDRTITPFGMYGLTPHLFSPFTWELHQGLNASIGMSLTYSPSRFAPSGVGFGQDATLLYALPLGKRWSVAAGLYAENMNWGGYNTRNVGIVGIAAYRVNERISLYAYGNKSLTPETNRYLAPYAFNPDRFGGVLNIDLGNHTNISFGIHNVVMPAGYYPLFY